MRIRIILLVALIIGLVLFVYCKSKKTAKEVTIKGNTTGKYEGFPAGQILEKVVCLDDESQSYALYLPKDPSLRSG